MTWVVGALVAIATLATSASLLIEARLRSISINIAEMTISIPPDEVSRPSEIDAFLGEILSVEGVLSARVVPAEELARSLGDLVETAAGLNGFALPVLIELQYHPLREPDRQTLHRMAENRFDRSELQENTQDMVERARDVSALQRVAIGSVVACLAGLVAIIALTGRNAMASHHSTLDLLRNMGADDRDLARQFEAKATGPLLASVFAGFVLGALASILLFWTPLGQGLWERGWRTMLHPPVLVALALVPALAGSAVVLTIRLVARRYLARME